MRLRRTMVGLSVFALGFMGLTSACATASELTDDDDDAPAVDASSDAQTGRTSSSSGSSSGRSSSSGGRSSSSGGSGGSSSGGSSSGGGTSGMLPPGPQPGSACEIPNERYKQGCGLCGEQEAKCGAGMVVTEYSECTDEVPASEGCVPGAVENNVACGYCGTQNRTCTNACRWSASTCAGQVEGNADTRCKPGETRLTDEDCPANQLTTWTCFPADHPTENLRCRWNIPDPSTSCAAPPTFINAPPAGSEASYTMFTFLQSSIRRPSSSTSTGACSTSATLTSYQGGWLQVRNTTASAIRVNVGSFVSDDLMMHVYQQATKPTTDTQLRTCMQNDTCSSSVMSGAQSCIGDVTIPANSSIWVLSSQYGSDAAIEHEIRVKTL